MLRMMTEIAVLCFVALLGVALATDAGMKAKVGKWKLDATSTNPMTGRSETHSSTDCLRDGDVSPEKFMDQTQQCSVSDVKTTDSSMDWRINCAFEGGSMTGVGHFESAGDTSSGHVKARVDAGGQTMNFEHRYVGTWLGPCD